MTGPTKTCSRCHQGKPLDDFKSDSRKLDGKASACKACVAVPRVGELPISTSKSLVPVFDVYDPQAWAQRINARWRQSIENYFETGDLLIISKATLPHGAFETMIETALMFHPSTARRLMIIAKDQRLRARVHALPASWGTIYELTKLSDDELDRGFEAKIIHTDMERNDIAQLRPAPQRSQQSSDGPGSPVGDNPRPRGESLQQGLDTSSKPGTVVGYSPRGEGSDAANVANPEATSDRSSHVPPGPSETAPLPNGARAIMGSRHEDDDSLDFFPTPPWATRALIEHVFAHLERKGHCKWQTAWEPACGEGHMAEPLKDYFKAVFATDIHDYGYGQVRDRDFLHVKSLVGGSFDWIITNPPFGDLGEAFVLKALDLAGTGVAMFMRVQWLDTIGRYERIFRDHPPTLIAFFAERVPLCKGRWDPKGSTATAYMWLVWIKGAEPRAPFWIPPGQREALTKPDDVERFGKIAEAEEAA